MKITISPQKSARLGMFCLKEAVLDILEQPEHRETGLKAGQISKRLGILTLLGHGSGRDYPFVGGILRHLLKEGYVTQVKTDGPWKLSK